MGTDRGYDPTRRPSGSEVFGATHALGHEEPPDPYIGRILHDRYRVIRLLGEGGMGVVYEAEHVLLQRRVALKLLHRTLARHPAVVTRFRNEAIAASSIGDPHIVEVSDMGKLEDGSFYMALELLDGREMRRLVEEDGPLTIARTIDLVSQVLEGLGAAHAANIVHRDLKPDNLFVVRRDGAEFVKILDFGVAKLRRDEQDLLTATGQAVGTPCYMPPEQARGQKDLDLRADLYAIGVILFECLTGARPFNAESLPLLIVQILQDPPPPIRAFRPDVPEELVAVVERLLAKEPHERFGSAAEVRAALAPFAKLASRPELAPNPPAHPSFAPPPRQKLATARLDEPAPTPPPPPTREAVPTPPPALPGRRSLLPWVLGGALAVALGGAAMGLAIATDEIETPDAGANSLTPAPLEPAAAPQVRLQIDTDPPGAELWLDGEVVPNPFDAQLPEREAPHHVEVRLAGHVTATREVSAHYAQRVHIPLTPEDADGHDRARRPSRAEDPAATSGRRAAASRQVEDSAPAEATPVTARREPAPPAVAPATSPPAEPEPAPPSPDELNHVRFGN
ncbi:MAG: serine/threonine protein kinase [Sandaracinaceae bacterium]|nr:serine/threonine protein kinase [Sandaracinaceae bacterium]